MNELFKIKTMEDLLGAVHSLLKDDFGLFWTIRLTPFVVKSEGFTTHDPTTHLYTLT